MIRLGSRSFTASLRAFFHIAASQSRSYLSSELGIRSIYFCISSALRLPLIAARAKGLYPIGDLAFDSARSLKLLHWSLSANALTLICHKRFSGTRNFFANLSASAKRRCCSRTFVAANRITEAIVPVTDVPPGATSADPYFVLTTSWSFRSSK